MDLASLATALKNNIQQNALTLTEAILPASVLADIKALFQLAESAGIVINGISADQIPDAPAGDITLSSGKINALGLKDAEIELVFGVESSATTLLASITLPSAWTFADSFNSLNFSPFNRFSLSRAYFIYTTQAKSQHVIWTDQPDKTLDLVPGMNFGSQLDLQNFPLLTPLLGANNSWVLTGTVASTQGASNQGTSNQGNSLPVLSIASRLAEGTVTLGVDPLTLSVDGLSLRAFIGEPADGVQPVGFYLDATTSSGLEIKVDIPDVGESLSVDVFPASGTPFGADKIIALPAASDFQSVIPSALTDIFSAVGLQMFSMVVQPSTVSHILLQVSTTSPWKVIPSVVELEQLALSVEKNSPGQTNSSTAVSLSAKAQVLPAVFTGEFDFYVDIQKPPQGSWEVARVRGNYVGSVTLGSLAGEFVAGASVPQFLNDISFSDIGIAVDHSAQSYQLSGAAAGEFEVLGKKLSVTLYANADSDAAGKSLFLTGGLSIADQNFGLMVQFESGGNGSDLTLTALWETDGAQGLGLDQIADEFGLQLPTIPPQFDLALQRAGFSYDISKQALVLEATSINYGSILLIALKGDKGWELSLGYHLTAAAIPSGFSLIWNALSADQQSLVNRLQKALDDEAARLSPIGSASAPPTVVHLSDMVTWIIAQFGGDLASQVPEVDLNGLSIAYVSSSGNFAFSGDTTTTIDIPFLTGDAAKIHASANLETLVDTATGKRQLSGFMEGDFTIGSSKFTLQYTLGQASHIFEASWQSTSDTDLLGIDSFFSAMGIDAPVVPAGVDLNLKKVYLQYQVERQTLKLVADSSVYGQTFLIVSKLPLGNPGNESDVPEPGTGSWEFVFGWDYPGKTSITDLPGIGSAFEGANIFHLSTIGLIVSSAKIDQFEIPELPAIKQLQAGVPPASSASGTAVTPVAQGNHIPLSKGVAVLAILDLGKSEQSDRMNALRQVVTETTLTILAEVDTTQKAFTLSALLQGSVTIPTGGSSDLRLGDAGLSFIFNDGITFQLYGDLALTFDHQTIDVKPKLSINPEEIEFSVPIVFENGWHEPMGIPGLTLDDIDFEMGLNLLPAPGINFGLEGSAHVGSQAPKADSFAFVLEIIEEVPDPLLLSFQLAEIDIKTAMEVFAPGADASSLPALVNEINLTDVNFYWAESVVVMPDGTIAQPGLRFGGNIELLEFSAHAAIAIDQVEGMAGSFEASPIHLHNILSVTGNGQGVYLNKKDGKTLPVTVKPEKDTSGVERVEVVPPGGPVFVFHTLQSPYLQLSAKVTFLDFLSEEIEALVANDGIYFKLEYDVGSLAKAEFDFLLGKSGFSAHSVFGLHLKADIGPIKILGIDFGTIHLDAGFDIEVTITANTDKFEFRITGDFEFEGARLSFPDIHLSVAPKTLAELPGIIIKQVEDNAEEIFKDLFDAAARLLKEGLKEAEHLAEEAGEEVAKLATEAEQEAEKLVNDAEKAIAHSAEEAAQAVAKVEQEAEQILTDAGKEVAKLGEEAVAEVEKIGKEISQVAQAAEHEIAAIGREIANEAKEVAQAVAKLASEAAAEVKAIAEAVEKEVQNILNAARQAADAVINAARKVVSALENEAKALWNEAKKLADEIANAAKKVGHAVEHAAKSAWHAISKY